MSLHFKSCSASYVNTVLECAERQGFSRRRLAHLAQLNTDELQCAEARVANYKLLNLVEHIQSLDPHGQFGLSLGKTFKPGTYGVLGFAMTCSQTLRQALSMLVEYEVLVQQVGRTVLVPEPPYLRIEWQPLLSGRDNLATFAEAAISALAGFGRWLTWDAAHPIQAVSFSHRASTKAAVYQDYFACDVSFEADCHSIVFDLQYLDSPLQQSDALLAALFKTQLTQQKRALSSPASYKHLVYELIYEQLDYQVLDGSSVAKRMRCSERSLRRRLSDEGTSLRQLLDQARRAKACFYLEQTSLSSLDVALRLGYQTQSAFCTAYKRWFGYSPGQRPQPSRSGRDYFVGSEASVGK